MDVTLCTSSILHLSCISLDRYFAIVDKPLLYNERVTPGKVGCTIALSWALSLLTGFVPVFTGIYSSTEHLELTRQNSASCDLVVNKYFSVIAGSNNNSDIKKDPFLRFLQLRVLNSCSCYPWLLF